MDIRIEKINSTQAKLIVLVPSTTVGQRIDNYYSSLAKKAKIPGFRPGKAPKNVVRQHFGQDSVADLIERMVAEFTSEAVENQNLELLYPPKLLATDVPDETKDFKFEVEIDLKPAVPEIRWEGLEIEDIETKPVTNDDVEGQLKILQDTEANFVPLIEDRGIINDDKVTLAFKGHWNGTYLPELQSEGHSFEVGKKHFLPDFETAILGMRKGEKKSFDVTFPEDYHAEKFRNQIVTFDTEILAIEVKKLPELTDELAAKLFPETPTLASLTDKIRAELAQQRERMRKKSLQDAVGDKLVDLHNFEVNERQLQTLAHQMAHEAHRMMHDMGVEHEENEENEKALHASSLKKAKRDIQLSYILQKIAEEQKFELVPDDFEKRFAETAAKTGYSVAQIKQYYASRDEDSPVSRLERLRIDILDEKSLDYALSKATMKNKG